MQSQAFEIWRRLITRFRLERPGLEESSHPSVGTEIVPVTQVDRLLQRPQAFNGTLALNPSAGTYVVAYTVPAGERWNLKHYHRQSSTANSRVLCQIGQTAIEHRLSVLGTGEAQDSVDIELNEGDTIGMTTSGDAGDTAIRFQVYIVAEDAF